MRQTLADVIIVGAGISGSVLAERYASKGKKVVVLEKRNHIGGNCYDYYNEHGILVSKYGAHLFHTNHEDVWSYIQAFTKWQSYEHKVVASVDGKLVPIPVNISTVNQLFGLQLQNEEEMRSWLKTVQVQFKKEPQNGEEAALARVGRDLYEKIFKYYTKKQWDKYPEELDASVLQRIPIRTTFDNRYFDDKYQAIPVDGYTKMFERMFDNPNIRIMLNTDFFDVEKQLLGYEKIFYTGPIDRYFAFKAGMIEKLEYRSLRFVEETLDQADYQGHAVINYPSADIPFTRVVEYKHIYGHKGPKTTIVREYSSDEGEPYYPVPNPRNELIYQQFKHEADKLTNVYFVGRLANYKYFNMDQAFKNALDLFNSLEASA
jgi:UDP-galactopyranose mutase